MKVKNFLAAAALMLALGIPPVGSVRADTLYNGTSLVEGQGSFVQSFNVTSPGVVTVTLTDLPWLDTVSGLSSFVSTATGVAASTAPGVQSYDVSAGTIYAHWFGEALGVYDIGVMGVNISFQAITSTPVSLPTSLVLMLSGLGLLFGWQSRRGGAGLVAA